MKLSSQALQQINNSATRMKIALVMGVTERWISAAIKVNKNDGFLTKVSALKVIEQETGLTQNEILTETVIETTAQS